VETAEQVYENAVVTANANMNKESVELLHLTRAYEDAKFVLDEVAERNTLAKAASAAASVSLIEGTKTAKITREKAVKRAMGARDSANRRAESAKNVAKTAANQVLAQALGVINGACAKSKDLLSDHLGAMRQIEFVLAEKKKTGTIDRSAQSAEIKVGGKDTTTATTDATTEAKTEGAKETTAAALKSDIASVGGKIVSGAEKMITAGAKTATKVVDAGKKLLNNLKKN
jgi:hypothetical protein